VPVKPAHLAQPDKRSLGRIAIVAARFDPDYQFETLTTGKGDAAGKSAITGALSCGEFLRGRDLLSGLLFLVCLPAGASAGAIHGALHAPTAQQVEEAKAAAQHGVAALKLQNEVIDAALHYGQEVGLDIGHLQQAMGPAKPEDFPTYTEIRSIADSIIEISVLHVKAFATGEPEPRISMGMQARVRVLGTQDGQEIDTFLVKSSSYARPVDEWLAAGGQAIRTEFDRGSASIAEQAIDETLLVYHPKTAIQQQAASTGSSQSGLVPPYALRTIDPPIRNKVYLSRMTYGHLERNPLNDLQPTFRWEPWPRGYDLIPGNGPGQAHLVRYDLRIFGGTGIVYERRGIEKAEHNLEQPLEPCHTYRWTVRARFALNDAPRATEWTGAYDTLGGSVAPWWWRRDSGFPPLALVPPSVVTFYPMIETPSIDGKECPNR
jgi:hypothetical protein